MGIFCSVNVVGEFMWMVTAMAIIPLLVVILAGIALLVDGLCAGVRRLARLWRSKRFKHYESAEKQ